MSTTDEINTSKSQTLPVDVRASQGIWLLLISLGVFFFASILLYIVYVYLRVNNASGHTQHFEMPWSFLPSTLCLLGVSVCLEMADRSAKRDRHRQVKGYMIASSVLGFAFMGIQSDGMKRLLEGLAESSSRSESVYGYTFILAFLHAAHVVGGMVGLWITTRQSLRHAYDHERRTGLRFCTLYWHFLDIVWLILIGSFWLTIWIVERRGG